MPISNEDWARRQVVRVRRLEDQGREDDLASTTAEERLKMMWGLAVDAWAFQGISIREQRLSRHIGRVLGRDG